MTLRLPVQLSRSLVVDQNPHMRRLIRSMLRSFGADIVEEACCASELVEKLERFDPEVMVIDGRLPLIDGITIARTIRAADSRMRHVPIIMCADRPTRRHVAAARDAGVNEYVCKPLSPLHLYRRVESVLVCPRPFVQTATYFGPDRRRVRRAGSVMLDRRAEPRH